MYVAFGLIGYTRLFKGPFFLFYYIQTVIRVCTIQNVEEFESRKDSVPSSREPPQTFVSITELMTCFYLFANSWKYFGVVEVCRGTLHTHTHTHTHVEGQRTQSWLRGRNESCHLHE